MGWFGVYMTLVAILGQAVLGPPFSFKTLPQLRRLWHDGGWSVAEQASDLRMASGAPLLRYPLHDGTVDIEPSVGSEFHIRANIRSVGP